MFFRKEEIYGKQKDNKTHGSNLCRDRRAVAYGRRAGAKP